MLNIYGWYMACTGLECQERIIELMGESMVACPADGFYQLITPYDHLEKLTTFSLATPGAPRRFNGSLAMSPMIFAVFLGIRKAFV